MSISGAILHATRARPNATGISNVSGQFLHSQFNRNWLLFFLHCKHCRMLGYRFTDDKIEPQDQYLKRLSGLQRLYSAILITKQRRSQQNQPHPHGIENGWIWLSNFLNLEPLPEICATLLLEFIQVCGSELWQTYQRQFLKLLLALQQAYMVKLDEVITAMWK